MDDGSGIANTAKMSIIHTLIEKFNAIPIKSSKGYFLKLKNITSEF